MEQNIVASQRGKIALLAVTIALVLTVSLVIIHNTDDSTATSYHDGDFVFIITDSNTASLVNYLGSGGTVEIPSVVTVDSIDYPVTVIDNSAFHSCARVESIVIPDGVNAINNYAFAGCTGLRMVNVPSTVTDIKQSAFEGCINLESITVDESNSNYKSVDGVLFSKDGKTLIVCPGGLTGDYVIPDGVETINSYAFYVCEKLNSVVIPEGIKSIDYKTFVSCLKMKSVSLPES